MERPESGVGAGNFGKSELESSILTPTPQPCYLRLQLNCNQLTLFCLTKPMF